MAVISGSFLSSEIGKQVAFTAILPHDTKTAPEWGIPVLYLLHGRTDNANTWLYRSNIERYATQRGLAVVMPDISLSYCTDMQNGAKYFSMVTNELHDVMASMFRVSFRREDTFIGGVSMGGYGALKCALMRPERYAGCIAISAITDIEQVILRDCKSGNEALWKGICGERLIIPMEMDIFRLIENNRNFVNVCPKFYIACGKNDEFFEQNLRLKEVLDKYRVDYTFEQAGAGHEWGFWDVAIQRGMDAVVPSTR
ncbi:MAG: esterase family protein [Oscillospiraceae bacterium]|jgi:S-formylglutathione hydrolase FrmB|nr:esterase family protein [Oscillospiraceae bacterium]